jgi:hypothetical protein
LGSRIDRRSFARAAAPEPVRISAGPPAIRMMATTIIAMKSSPDPSTVVHDLPQGE